MTKFIVKIHVQHNYLGKVEQNPVFSGLREDMCIHIFEYPGIPPAIRRYVFTYLRIARRIQLSSSNLRIARVYAITVNPFYNGIRYNRKILYNVNPICIKISGSCIFL